ncbi:MAG: oligosaccharide flippase family protein [Ruminococcus sp.]|nr:oligosaccharide flippase family protein [Ruminococcus sp.]
MSREKSFVKNMGILSIGTFLPKLFSFVSLPILTACLTKEEYGTYDLISTLVMLLLPAVTLQIQSAAFRFLIECRKDEVKTKSIITNMLCFTMVISVICMAVMCFCLRFLSPILQIEIVIYFILDIFLATVQQISRGVGENLTYSISAVISSVVNLIVIITCVYYVNGGLEGVMLALSASVAAAVIYIAIKLKLWKKIDFSLLSKKQLLELLNYSWPMVPNNLSSWVLAVSDRLVITAFCGIEANAVYAVANKIPNLLKIMQSTFTYAWQENASIAVNDKDSSKYYSHMFDTMFCFLSGAVAGLFAFMPIIFSILIKGDYGEAYAQIPILLIAFMFNCMAVFMGGIYVAHKKTKSVGITTVVAAIINLAIDLIFVNLIGIYAGSISTLVSYAVLLVYRMLDVQKIEKIAYPYRKMIAILGCLVAMSVLLVQRNLVCDIINVIFGFAVVLIFNREMIKSLFMFGLKKIKRQ